MRLIISVTWGLLAIAGSLGVQSAFGTYQGILWTISMHFLLAWTIYYAKKIGQSSP